MTRRSTFWPRSKANASCKDSRNESKNLTLIFLFAIPGPNKKLLPFSVRLVASTPSAAAYYVAKEMRSCYTAAVREEQTTPANRETIPAARKVAQLDDRALLAPAGMCAIKLPPKK